jgi:hypothetical protein
MNSKPMNAITHGISSAKHPPSFKTAALSTDAEWPQNGTKRHKKWNRQFSSFL